MRRRSAVSQLYAAARLANDVSVVASGNPHRIARRRRTRSWDGRWGVADSGAHSGARLGDRD